MSDYNDIKKKENRSTTSFDKKFSLKDIDPELNYENVDPGFLEYLNNTIFIMLDDKLKPKLLGSPSEKQFGVATLHNKIWEEAHKLVEKKSYTLLSALKKTISKYGYNYTVVNPNDEFLKED